MTAAKKATSWVLVEHASDPAMGLYTHALVVPSGIIVRTTSVRGMQGEHVTESTVFVPVGGTPWADARLYMQQFIRGGA